MLNDPLFLILAFAVIAVLVVLVIGVLGFAMGGEFNRKHGNRMMRYRIIAQAIAILLIIIYVVARRGG